MLALLACCSLALQPAASFRAPAGRRPVTRLGSTTMQPTVEVDLLGNVAYPHAEDEVHPAAALLASKFGNFEVSAYSEGRTKVPTLDLSGLSSVSVGDGVVTLGAGVSVGRLARVLSENELELAAPLPADGSRSVLESALTAGDPLGASVKEVRVAAGDGSFSTAIGAEGVPVSITLATAPATTGVHSRWYHLRRDGDAAHALAELPPLPEEATAFAFVAGPGSPAQITVIVTGAEELALPEGEEKHWDVHVARTPADFQAQRSLFFRTALLDELTASRTGTVVDAPQPAKLLETLDAHDSRLLLEVTAGSVRAYYADEGAAAAAETLGKVSTVDKPPATVESDLQTAFEMLGKAPTLSGALGALQSTHGAPDLPGLRPVILKRKLKREMWDRPPVEGQALALKLGAPRRSGTVIPGFSGEVYDAKSPGYDKNRHQYATPSFDDEMKPALVAYPHTLDDVKAAIKYAKENDIKISGRSGGHHYCGVSADTGTLCLSMDFFDHYDIIENLDIQSSWPDGRPRHVTTELRLGAGNILGDVAKKNMHNGFSFPHGECPGVGIGGHMQSGGYGHTVRSLGLCLDYIVEITVVLDEEHGGVQTVRRDSTDQADKDLFFAVAGGSPGAYGVVVEAVWQPVLDTEFPKSTSYYQVCPVAGNFARQAIENHLTFCKNFANRALDGDEDELADAISCEMTLLTHQTNFIFGLDWNLKPALPTESIVELVCSDPDQVVTRKDGSTITAGEQFAELVADYKKNVEDKIPKWQTAMNSVWVDVMLLFSHRTKRDGHSYYPMSDLAYGYTRSAPFIKFQGHDNDREFQEALPFDKATYGVDGKVPDAWPKVFGNLLFDVHSKGYSGDSNVHVMWQTVLNGGQAQKAGASGQTSIGHRNVRLMSTFDLFRSPASAQEAADYQTRNLEEVVYPLLNKDPKIMQTWASRPEALDMDDPAIWPMYYDVPANYHKLREIKTTVDPDNIFSSRMTLRPGQAQDAPEP